MPATALILVFLVAAVWVAFLFRTLTGRNILFGGNIVRTWDGVSGKRKIYNSEVKVHAVDVSPGLRFVGLEIGTGRIGSYSAIPISLPKAEALELARLIQEAANHPADS